LAELMRLQNSLSERINAIKLGTVVEVLVEGRHKKISSFLRGRIPQNTLVDVHGAAGNKPGDLLQVRICGSSAYGLAGRTEN
jgi:tRNA A37 methylthiotransferase MiaB